MVEKTTGFAGARTEMMTFGNRVNAFLAIPEDAPPPYPVVMLCHERYGLVQHTLDLAAKWAADGYMSIAPDLFSRWEGDKEALNRGEFMVPITDDEIRIYMGETLDYLLEHPDVDSSRIAVMGVCQSGEYPLVLNSFRDEVAANIVVYGGAQRGIVNVWDIGEVRKEPYEDILKRVTAPIVGIWGEDDFVVSVDDVQLLRNTLEKNMKTYVFKLYRDMPHGWFNSTMPGRYRPKETEDAWAYIKQFLDGVYAGAFPRDRILWRFESDIAADYDFTKKYRQA